MKPRRVSRLALLGLMLSPCLSLLHAEDWTTTDGKVYRSVTVVKTEADAVTILCHDGGALVPLAKLPPDLQKRFNYDPVKAQTAADARAKAQAVNAQALQTESEQAAKLKAAKLAEQKAQQKAAKAALKANAAATYSEPSSDVLGSPNGYVDSDVLNKQK